MAYPFIDPLNKKEVIDHKNTNTEDNRIENLQLYENNGKHLSETLSKYSEQNLLYRTAKMKSNK